MTFTFPKSREFSDGELLALYARVFSNCAVSHKLGYGEDEGDEAIEEAFQDGLDDTELHQDGLIIRSANGDEIYRGIPRPEDPTDALGDKVDYTTVPSEY